MRDQASGLQPGDIEMELGVAIAGTILPPEQWAKTAIKKLPPPEPIDWTAWFGRSAPIVLDLGCGNGRFLIASAVRRPDVDHVGLDALPMVIRYATRRANQRGLHNARLLVSGAFEFLEQYVAPHSVAEIHIYHPQPYHDTEKAYRRLVTPEFLSLVHRGLCPTGQIVVQTDNQAYWAYLREILPEFFAFTERHEPWPEDPHGRTRREIMATRQGLTIFRGSGQPRTLSDDQLAELVARLPMPVFASTPRSPNRARRHGRGPWRRRR